MVCLQVTVCLDPCPYSKRCLELFLTWSCFSEVGFWEVRIGSVRIVGHSYRAPEGIPAIIPAEVGFSEFAR